MSYIGRNIDSINNISTLDNLSFNGSDATFNLTQNSVAFVPVSADALQIQIDGVIQANNFTISGSTLTFDFTPNSGSVCNSIKHFGVGLLTTVSDGAVTTAKLGNNSVGITQLNVSDGSNGQALTTNGSGTLAFADAGLSGWSSNSNNLLPSDASKGIYLGVNSATSSNLLNDYEEGEFANALSIDGTTQTNYSSGRSHLKYVKIGSLVHCAGLIDTDGQTLQDTGQIYVRLPFAVASSGSNSYNASKVFSDVMGGGSTHPGYFYVQENDTQCEFDTIDTSGSTAVDGNGLSVTNTSHRVFMFLDITYQTDA